MAGENDPSSAGRVPARTSSSAGAGVSVLSPEVLLPRAQKLARLTDFGPDVLPALETFCGFFGEVALAETARFNLANHVTRALVTRLRLTHALKQTPERFAASLDQPLIVTGLPRTGTTYLHRLLASLPKRRFLRFWEAWEPIPDAEEDNRIPYYEHLATLMAQARPRLEVQHPVDAQGPEECLFLTDPSLVSMSFVWVDAPCVAYVDWVHDPRHTEPYQIYRQLLLYLAKNSPEQRMVLKSPAHVAQLTALSRAVPEARIVQLHRDPLAALASLCSLLETLLSSSVTTFNRNRFGQEALRFVEMALTRNAEQRAELPAKACLDLRFEELAREPLASVRRIHDYFELGWSAEDDRALCLQLARGKPPEVGRHQYSLADYGLSAGEVAERFQTYRQRWGFA